jgi:hypothetical protein
MAKSTYHLRVTPVRKPLFHVPKPDLGATIQACRGTGRLSVEENTFLANLRWRRQPPQQWQWRLLWKIARRVGAM